MKKLTSHILLLLIGCLPLLSNAQNDVLTIHFKNMVGNNPLTLFEQTYNNKFNEPFTVNKFKYYIADLVIKGANKQVKVWHEPKLIDEEDSASKNITITAPNFQVNTIEFTIGVDSSYNVNGVQVGDLDPMKGMFWTWNSGYVYAKIEGQSDSSHAPSHYFSYHVGGYKNGENALRKVVLKTELNNVTKPPHEIIIEADALQWFSAEKDIKIGISPICHQPGFFALQLANNYQHMFHIGLIK